MTQSTDDIAAERVKALQKYSTIYDSMQVEDLIAAGIGQANHTLQHLMNPYDAPELRYAPVMWPPAWDPDTWKPSENAYEELIRAAAFFASAADALRYKHAPTNSGVEEETPKISLGDEENIA